MAKNDLKKVSAAEKTRELSALMQSRNAANAKRTRYIFAGILGAVVVIAVGSIFAMHILNPNSADNIAKKADEMQQTGEGPKSVWAKDGSITISKDGVGEAKANKSLPTLDIYNDFICPACGNFENQFGDTIKQAITNGVANVRFHPLAWFDNTSRVYKTDSSGKKTLTERNYAYSTRAAAAAFYIGEKAPDKYLDFVTAMYDTANQPEEGEKYSQDEGTKAGSNEAIVKKIVSAGISESIAKAAVGLDGNAPKVDWANEFKDAAAALAADGVQGGPYVRYAQAIGKLVSASGKIKATPAIFIINVSGAESVFDLASQTVKQTPETLLDALKKAKN